MNLQEELENRIEYLLKLGGELKKSATEEGVWGNYYYNNKELFYKFYTLSLSFLKMLYSKENIYYENFECIYMSVRDIDKAFGILNAVKCEISNNWLYSLKKIIVENVFSNYMEEAKYLLEKNYKVII